MAKSHDVDGYPTVCVVCDKPIVKSRHDSQHHTDVATNTATSWHSSCSKSTHPFFCKGQPASLQLVLGGWFCSECGGKVDWVVA
jgi:hypothetical protein